MTMMSVYVGDLDDPKFKWEGGDWNGNVPRPLIPHLSLSHRVVLAKIDSGELEGKQVDWGASVARVTPEQLEALVRAYHAETPPYGPPHEAARASELERLGTLTAGKQYALVVREEMG